MASIENGGAATKGEPGNNTLAELNFIPKMDTRELLADYRRILEKI